MGKGCPRVINFSLSISSRCGTPPCFHTQALATTPLVTMKALPPTYDGVREVWYHALFMNMTSCEMLVLGEGMKENNIFTPPQGNSSVLSTYAIIQES